MFESGRSHTPDEYDTVKVRYFSKSYIKGCVSGNFETLEQGVEGSNGERTDCTQAGKSPYDGTSAQNADFENKSADWIQFMLSVNSRANLLSHSNLLS